MNLEMSPCLSALMSKTTLKNRAKLVRLVCHPRGRGVMLFIKGFKGSSLVCFGPPHRLSGGDNITCLGLYSLSFIETKYLGAIGKKAWLHHSVGGALGKRSVPYLQMECIVIMDRLMRQTQKEIVNVSFHCM